MTFNFQAWSAGIDKRVKNLEDCVRAQHAWQKNMAGAPGLAGDERSAGIMQRGHENISRELSSVKARLNDALGESRSLRSIVSGIDGTSHELRQAMAHVESRLRTLSYHVGIYDEVVQGIAIRPERAVPATRTDESTGAAVINPVKVHTKSFWLATTTRTVTIPAGQTTSVSFVIPPEQNLEGDMEIFFLELARATSTQIRVRLQHTGLGSIYLSNQPHHILSAFGNMNAGCQPFSMFESIFLEAGMELVVELTDFSGFPNTVELVAHGRKFIGYTTSGMDRRGLINVFARNTWPLWVTSDQPVVLNPGVNIETTFSLTIPRQYHAELGKVMQFGTIGGVPAPVNYHLRMNEGQSGNLLVDTVPINTVAGNGNFPYIMPEPYLALRGTQLFARAFNDSGATGQSTDLVFHGRGLPLSFPGQRTLEPLLDGRDVELPPASNKDLWIPRMVSD